MKLYHQNWCFVEKNEKQGCPDLLSQGGSNTRLRLLVVLFVMSQIDNDNFEICCGEYFKIWDL